MLSPRVKSVMNKVKDNTKYKDNIITDEVQILNSLISQVETACSPNEVCISSLHRTYEVLH